IRPITIESRFMESHGHARFKHRDDDNKESEPREDMHEAVGLHERSEISAIHASEGVCWARNERSTSEPTNTRSDWMSTASTASAITTSGPGSDSSSVARNVLPEANTTS